MPTSAHPCDFCLLLASRGFVYSSEKSAGELNKFHNGCRCKIVPGFGDNPKLKGYDPEALAASCKHRKGYREAMEERDARIAAGALDKLKQNQLYHLEGTKQFEQVANARGKKPSFFTLSKEEVMELIKHYAGTGIPELTKTGIWANKEICVADTEIGYVYGSNGKKIPTRKFKIHYAKDGVHAVPMYDERKN